MKQNIWLLYKYRKSLIDIISDTKTNQADNDASFESVLKLFEQLKGEKKKHLQFMENKMIDLYNDDDKHGQIERAYRENYLFSLLRFHVLELYGNDVFRKARKNGNKIFINLPIPQQEERHYQHNYHHYRSQAHFIMTMSSFSI